MNTYMEVSGWGKLRKEKLLLDANQQTATAVSLVTLFPTSPAQPPHLGTTSTGTYFSRTTAKHK